MATYKCNDGVYTVLRNGKVIAFNTTSATALTAVISDAANVVCPPDCCISDVAVALDAFDIEVTTGTPTGLFIRATITHNEDTYSTAWAACTGLDTIDLTGLVVEVGGWFSGDDLCIEYSYDQIGVIQGCCADIITETYEDEDTYDLTGLVRDCNTGETSLFELLYQNPDGGVTVSPDGELEIPDIPDTETVFISRKCGGCLTELLVITANADPLGLRLTYTTGNLPANNLAAWNAFFDLPANGTAFTSMSTAGDEVTLFGGAGITLKASLFRTSEKLLKIEDDIDCVVAIAGGKNTGALSLCPNLTTVTLNGVITVAQQGLYANAALVNLSLDACTTAGNAAFQSNTSMVTFSLPALLTAAGSAFSDCTSATTFTLPLFTSAGNSCFMGCTAATTFTLPQLTSAGDNCFRDCTSATTFTLPLLTSAGNDCFSSCTAATTFTLPELLTAGNLCFANCTSNVTFNIPKLTTAYVECFKNCTAATTFTLPELLTAGANCFDACSNNITFNLPKVTSVGAQCFKSCSSATTFTLPLCTTIGDGCFDSCTAATTFNLSACTALGSTTGDNGVFAAISGNTITVTVPTALQTCDAGSPDGDLVWLAANNTATINYI
jgi:hypothetical protein